MKHLDGLRCCAAMRHETSINAVFGFVSGLGGDVAGFHAIVMDRALQSPAEFMAARDALMESVRKAKADVYVLASKINDAEGAGLVELLEGMKREGLGARPVVVTFLNSPAEEYKKSLRGTGVSVHFVEQDNLGFPKPKDGPETVRTGMSKLGPALIAACT